ncbi:TIGR03619 family F420-dependent LLM class oxidoreductase [Phenylobacterium montanum]|uniref:TIGR03619 family F420-dependent LLM class oxidoreductase n=1 Tax=Phenylobacterium montanum TaxID=2823693 RepID=A0A975G4F1_9CAUL|nr:TIGR03619 family F420-dependent LLM class oxidoreductase [Caulobacter sp. S6]QUD90369.1 TIGR03619 family F420-dependent LLM class oxidoreductase [Caulobacter sp. S6]
MTRRTIGITTYDYTPTDLLNLAVHAERLGFEGLWFGEHYVIPERYDGHHPSRKETPADKNDARDKAILGEQVRIYDPWFLLGAVAGATKRLKIGTAICIAPMNHPLLLARHTATAHDVSGGRFLLGTGAGWLKEEFDAVGIPFNERGSRLDEIIEVLKKAWAGGFFAHEGKHFRFDSLQITPHPVKVPLVCGGNTGPALRRVAEVADAWINSAMVALDEAEALREVIEKERQARGTARRPFDYYVRPQSPDPDLIERFFAAGFDNLVLWGPNIWPNDDTIPLADKVAGLERVARDLGLAAV